MKPEWTPYTQLEQDMAGAIAECLQVFGNGTHCGIGFNCGENQSISRMAKILLRLNIKSAHYESLARLEGSNGRD